MLLTSSMLAIVAGMLMVCGGTWGIVFTYQNVVQEKIVTPPDATIPNTPVAGPFTLMAQAQIIRHHTLTATGGKTFAEMPRQIAQVDKNGKPVLGSDGKPVMIDNAARNIWVTATTLTTALNLGIITYAFSSLILFLGLISIWTGITFYGLRKKM